MIGMEGHTGMTLVIETEGDEMFPLTRSERKEVTAEKKPISRRQMESRYVRACQSQLTFRTLLIITKTPGPLAQTDEEKKADRLAKLEAWKQKQAAEKDRKQKESEASGGTRKLLAEIDKKANLPPAIASPRSPIIPAEVTEPSSPAPYAGKFDPKAIAKRAAAASSGPSISKLGTDIAVPDLIKASATKTSNKNGLHANNTVASVNGSTGKLYNLSFPHVDNLWLTTFPSSHRRTSQSSWQCQWIWAL